ncbi:MAG TPA: 6,7-dimethyl-8-ribityllumazine synthase [Candidatus Synoicihabitans sp.]|nr:6,7-dimethyl-8-ribityllumazine synthase [Candidatus Synoicihabitans sp.]
MSLDSPAARAVAGARLKIGIVAARYNARLVDALLAQAQQKFAAAGVKPKNVQIARVPGSGELPFAAQALIAQQRPHVVLALGVIIRGDTIHYQLVAEAAQQGLLRVGLDARLPVIVGVVVAENQPQAEARCLGAIDRGAEFAQAALEMAVLPRTFRR